MSRTILILGARAPVALHLARLFSDAGIPVIVADSLKYALAFASNRVHAKEVLPTANENTTAYIKAIKAMIERYGITDVIPTCEEVFYVSMHWEVVGSDAKLHVPDIQTLASAHNKFAFIQRAQTYGLSVPETRLLESEQDVDAVRSELSNLVLKPAWSRFGSDVKIRPPSKSVQISPSADQPWVAQEVLDGDEICAYAVAYQGRLVALSTYCCDYRAGKGAGIFFKPIVNENVRSFVTQFIERSNWHGQISFDFMQTKDGQVLPLECNPRATSGLHFFSDGNAFADAMLNGTPVEPDVTIPQTIPLAMWFYAAPKALRFGKWKQFRMDLRSANNILQWPSDNSADGYQWCTMAEIAALALSRRISLQAASTADIEWNGHQSSI